MRKKSPGIDYIEILKETESELGPLLVSLRNDIFVKGKCPKGFKKVVVTPIHKKGSKKELSNYRALSLLTMFTNCFKKAVKARLSRYNVLCNFRSNW